MASPDESWARGTRRRLVRPRATRPPGRRRGRRARLRTRSGTRRPTSPGWRTRSSTARPAASTSPAPRVPPTARTSAGTSASSPSLTKMFIFCEWDSQTMSIMQSITESSE